MPSLALEVQRGGIPGQPGATPSQVGLICSSEPVSCPSMSLLVYRRLGDTNFEQSRLSGARLEPRGPKKSIEPTSTAGPETVLDCPSNSEPRTYYQKWA